jgi:NADPH:quinone reductase-like Zn-dependent oxidoreductase
MKAIVCTKYGPPLDILQLKEVDKPTPNDHQVLVKVHAASINISDLAPVRGKFLARLLGTGLRKPKREILGADIAGLVEAVGTNVKQFKPGDEVFGDASGALAEYALAREDLLALKPNNVTFEEAAAVGVAATTALQGLRKGKIQAGQKVLVNGASGAVGTYAVLIAKSFGAEVTAVCSTKNLDQARSMGSDHVIDYTQEDFTKNGQRYDLILCVNGYHSILDYRRALNPNGIAIVLGGSFLQIIQSLALGPLISKTGRKKIAFMGIAHLNQKDLIYLQGLLEAGKVKPVIDRRYPLRETANALSYLEKGHARAKVVIAVDESQT